jgi:hypothetical protein
MSDKKVENLIINKLTKEQYQALENKSDTELYVITDDEHVTLEEIQKKVDKIEGKSLISDTEIERLASVKNYDDTEVKKDIKINAENIEINKNDIATNTSDITDLQNTKQDKLTAGKGLEITEDNIINNTQTSAEWGNITGDITTQGDLTNALNKKANTQETGNNLSYTDSLLILNNKDGNILSSVTIKSTPDTDDKTIHLNKENKLEAIGVTTQSDTIMVNWEGTLEEYETGLEDGSIDPEWYCYITDDEQTIDYSDRVSYKYIKDITIDIPDNGE